MSETILHKGYFTYVETDVLGRQRQILKTQDSVTLLLYVSDLRTIVLVRQPRETMVRDDNPEGMIVECIAGRFDKNLGLRELAVQEAKEEAGADITIEQIEVLNHGRPVAVSAGALTERSYLCFAEITSRQITVDLERFSAVEEDERIERVMLPVEALDACIWEDARVMLLVNHLQRKLEREGAI